MSNFITNQRDVRTLKTRLKQLVEHSGELKFLSGFFYFSGWQQLYDNIKDRQDIVFKVLVGLDVDQFLGQSCEISCNDDKLTRNEKVDRFFLSLNKAINSEELDIREFHEQIDLFLRMIEEGRLQIRKTYEPNHSKLYIFKYKDELQTLGVSRFITGSSNLTRAGIEHQHEFNVEISDYGTKEAEDYFDNLWEEAVPITEDENRKNSLIEFIQNRSQAASITPFEAYALVLKTYIDIMEQKKANPQLLSILEQKGYHNYSYQMDAVNQALTIIEEHSGVIIADVVGLGKSVIAGMIGKSMGKRGLIICPPGLIGDDNAESGWKKYLHDFELHHWAIKSSGKLEDIVDYINNQGNDIEVVIVDEAHRYRNQDTSAYEALSLICRNRKVILLTATPFNNSPADIFSLLKLFIVPGQSGITLDDNIEMRFTSYERLFRKLSFIIKNHASSDPEKRGRSEKHYHQIFDSLPIDIKKVKDRSKELSMEIKAILEPVLIRRNRIDLQKDHQYSKEIKNLSQIKDPDELLFELTVEQSNFYDRVIQEYFAEDGRFTGAIYQPFNYEKKSKKEDFDKEENREFLQQKNLYDFMRRLLVKRFESSFGAFSKSICNFERIHRNILTFIENSGGKYILDRNLIEKIYEEEEEAIERHLEEFTIQLANKKQPKNQKVYDVNKFTEHSKFIQHIKSDLELLKEIQEEIRNLQLTTQDPKANKLVETLKENLRKDPNRKIIIFTEYIDTAQHLENYLMKHFPDRLLSFTGTMSGKLLNELSHNFDAGVNVKKQEDKYDILLASDKISEGFNLNRAGTIINYDIPWNPTRVIQRVGRINRIGKKLFDELLLFNFFPTLQGADVIKSREIATQKMFLIHNTLGEDSKIFAVDETPSASELYKRLTSLQDEGDESFAIKIRNTYFTIKDNHPEVISKIEQLPVRVKTAKQHDENQLIVLRRKGISLFMQTVSEAEKKEAEVNIVDFESILPFVQCEYETPKVQTSKYFWDNYEKIKAYKPKFKSSNNDNSLEIKALNNMQSALRFYEGQLDSLAPFIRVLIEDLHDYFTLPKYTLRKLTQFELKANSHKKDIEAFVKALKELEQYLGDDYLEKIKSRISKQKKEIIIAIENVK